MDNLARTVAYGDTGLKLWRERGGAWQAPLAAELEAIAMVGQGACVFAADAAGEVAVYDRNGRRRARLALFDRERWLAYADEGAYAGATAALPSLRLVAEDGFVSSVTPPTTKNPDEVWGVIRQSCGIKSPVLP